MEADLQHYYGIALGDLATGALTWRRLRVLLSKLPPNSTTAQSIQGPRAEWSTGDYLLAHLVDLLAAANWQRANSGRKNASRKPTPIPRPHQRPQRNRIEITAEQLLDHRRRMAERG